MQRETKSWQHLKCVAYSHKSQIGCAGSLSKLIAEIKCSIIRGVINPFDKVDAESEKHGESLAIKSTPK